MALKCASCGFYTARTMEADLHRCLYCNLEFRAPGPSRFIQFPDFVYQNNEKYRGPRDGLHAAILDFIDRHEPYEGPILDIGGYEGPYRALFPEPYHIVDHGAEFGPVENGFVPVHELRFPTIVSTEALEHLDDPITLFSEIRRLLRTGGRLILSTPIAWGYHPSPKDHWRMQPDGFLYLCKRNGLIPLQMEFVELGKGAVMGLYAAANG